MRTLTKEHKELLKSHLSNKRLEYVELYDEIFDHYATAYELGDKELGEIINQLDQHFTQEYIDDHREQITKRIYKSIKLAYTKEIRNFIQWPQIVTSILSGLLIIALAYLMPEDIFKLYILLPTFILPIVPFLFFLLQEHRKLVPHNLNSAALKAMNKIMIYPLFLFYGFYIISILLDANNISDKATAIIFGVFVMIFIAYDIITIKVFKQKIKYQMA